MSIRTERVEDLVLREISGIISNKVRDPRVGFVTVMSVTITPDLRIAKVYVSTIGGEHEQKSCVAGLRTAASYIRRELARTLQLKTVPELNFYYDESPERGEQVIELLKGLEEQSVDPGQSETGC